ncbi:hypothetical protein HN51_020235 [Arachis hypogaea]|nr:uncharacterized protein DS421_8g247360 [Arachis hypogaea]
MVRKEILVCVIFSYLFISITFLATSTNADTTIVKLPRPALTTKVAVHNNSTKNIEGNGIECCVWFIKCVKHCRCRINCHNSETKMAEELPH